MAAASPAQSLGRYRSSSNCETCVLYSCHSARLLRMNHSKTCSPSASATSSDRSISSSASASEPGQGRDDALGQALLLGELVEVGGGLGREVVALLDAPQARGEHDGEGEVRVAGRVGRPELDAGRVRLARLDRRHVDDDRTVVAGPRHVHGRLEPRTSRL